MHFDRLPGVRSGYIDEASGVMRCAARSHDDPQFERK